MKCDACLKPLNRGVKVLIPSASSQYNEEEPSSLANRDFCIPCFKVFLETGKF